MNVEHMPAYMMAHPTLPYIGDRDPLLARLWAVIEGYAYRAGIDRADAAVMLANSVMPRSGH